MSIHQAEGWHLWEKSMIKRRQAPRRVVASVPRRGCLASILVVLLTGTWLLGTSAFGGSGGCRCGIIKCIKCLPPYPNKQVEDECCKCFEDCQKAPALVDKKLRERTWSVKARNCMEATNATLPGMVESATAEPQMRWKSRYTIINNEKKDGLVTLTARLKFTIDTEMVVTMPDWKFPKGYSGQCKVIWNDAVQRLRVHEDGHIKIFMEWDKKIRERALVLSREYFGQGSNRAEAKADLEAKIEKSNNEVETMLNKHMTEQDEYDDVTEHGRNPNNPKNRWNRGAKTTVVQCPKDC